MVDSQVNEKIINALIVHLLRKVNCKEFRRKRELNGKLKCLKLKEFNAIALYRNSKQIETISEILSKLK